MRRWLEKKQQKTKRMVEKNMAEDKTGCLPLDWLIGLLYRVAKKIDRA